MKNAVDSLLIVPVASLSAETLSMLDMQTDDVPSSYDLQGNGWFVMVPSQPFGAKGPGLQDPHTCPEDLRAVLNEARSKGCGWIMVSIV
jgi:hypothetical protein